MWFRAWALVMAILVAGSAAADLNPVKFLKKPRHPPVDLARNGKPRAAIHLAIRPSPTLTLVVKKLVEAIRLTTGATLPVTVSPDPQMPEIDTLIVVGDCPAAREAGIDVEETPWKGSRC